MATSIKVKIDKTNLVKKTKEIINKAVSEDVLNEIGETLVRLNQKNARIGKTGDGSSFPSLSKEWKERRNSLAKKTPTDLAFGRNKSNATFTGQLIRSIFYKINLNLKSVTVDFNSEKRDRYINEKGLAVGNPDTTNKDIALGFNDRGIKILGINKEMKDRIDFILSSAIRKLIK